MVMKNRKKILIISLTLLASFTSAAETVTKGMKKVIDDALDFSVKQSMSMFYEMKDQKGILPRTAENGKMITCESAWWTSGFYPGTLWYCYEYSNDPQIRAAAEEMTSRVEKQKYTTSNHDVGFIINCSFGNGYRLTHNETYRKVIETAAKSLSTRFHPVTGCTRSWNSKKWQFSVIIDNMMNLDLLFMASKLTGISKYKNIAVQHANKTKDNHFRPDYTCWHVVSYNNDGTVECKQTFQGKNDNSSWARGQAWAVYGYTYCYRETKDKAFLNRAVKIADMIMERVKTDDAIPYWDYDAPITEETPRDASAAAITASAFLELSTMVTDGNLYLLYAEKILKSLSSEKYLSKVGENEGFILRHSTGSLPNGSEIDTPINYADYYFLEALKRYIDLKNIKL